jgi:hypothetical protein
MHTRAFFAAVRAPTNTVNSRDARIPNSAHSIAHRFAGQRRFFRNGNVACACRDDADLARAALCFVALNAYHARRFVPLSIRRNVAHFAEHALVRARHKHVGRALYEPLDDADNLRASFPCAENDFGKALSSARA